LPVTILVMPRVGLAFGSVGLEHDIVVSVGGDPAIRELSDLEAIPLVGKIGAAVLVVTQP
jgi:hypothetical protein